MKETNLNNFFLQHARVALAFSGGVDSAYLLYAAKSCGVQVKAYFVKSQFQPDFELEDARRIAEELSTELVIISCDVLAEKKIRENPVDRCYHCKNKIFSKILEAAAADGFDTVIDGTNASDDAGDRPGMRALAEMKVLSPLRICGITKEEVRARSKEAGLFTWDKAAYACLATRVPTGESISEEKLQKIYGAEKILHQMGFSDFRVRLYHGAARLQLPGKELERAAVLRKEIREKLKPHFKKIFLDLEER